VLTLADAAMLVVARGRLMQALPAGGAMVAVAAGEDEVAPLLGEGVGIAAINAPESVTISGAQAAVSAIADRFAAQGRRVHRLAVSHAFHSPLMEPMLEEFARVAAGVEAREPQIGLVSNVTGELVGPDGDFGSAQYWVDHVRRPVRFADSVRHLQTRGASHFIEAGPGSGLTGSIEQSLSSAEAVVVVVSMLGKDRPEVASVLGAAGQLFTTGVPVDWPAVFAGSGGRRMELPTYAFQRRRFWETPSSGGSADAAGLGLGGANHALLGAVVERPDSGAVVLTGRLALADQPWLADHMVGGRQVDDTGDATQSKSALAQRLHGLAPNEQHELLVGLVCLQAAAVLGHPAPEDIDPDTAFQDLGFDSPTAVELRNRLKTATGLTLPPTLIFDHPTPTAVATLFGAQLNGIGAKGVSPLEEELKKLEEIVVAIGTGEKQRVADRLRALLGTITDSEDHLGKRIQAASTPDEIFQLIDSEFGES
jgi:acyl transferase domain-containing protein